MITKVAVLGSGTMGAQIAAHMANAGLSVLLLDLTTDQTDRAFRSLAKLSPAPFFTPEKAKQIQTGSFDNDLPRIRDADWIVEAVVENAAIKHQLLEAVDKVRRPGSLITTNTSGLSVAALAIDRSPDFRRCWFGTHFFNPPRYMRLLEIIPTAETDPKATGRVRTICRSRPGKRNRSSERHAKLHRKPDWIVRSSQDHSAHARAGFYDRGSRSPYRPADRSGQNGDIPDDRYGRSRCIHARRAEHLRQCAERTHSVRRFKYPTSCARCSRKSCSA